MKEKKEKKKWGVIIFLVIITVGTSFSLFTGFSAPDDVVRYNGLKFTRQNTLWIAKINGHEAVFTSLPSDAEKINMSGDVVNLLTNKVEIDVTYDYNTTFKESISLAQYQMGLTLANYNIFLRQGYIKSNPYSQPVIKCSDATQNVPVIFFRQANSTKIYAKDSCVYAESSNANDFARVKDRLLFAIFGVLK